MKTAFIGIVCLTVAALSYSSAVAQTPSRAGYNLNPKVLGYTFTPSVGGSQLYRQHAANHVEVLRHYAGQQVPIPADVAKEHVVEVRRNLDKSFAELEKIEGDLKNDKSAQSLLASIKAIHKNADEACKMLETECAKQAVEGAQVADCCTDMLKQLEAATVLHDQLLKHLGHHASPAKK